MISSIAADRFGTETTAAVQSRTKRSVNDPGYWEDRGDTVLAAFVFGKKTEGRGPGERELTVVNHNRVDLAHS